MKLFRDRKNGGRGPNGLTRLDPRTKILGLAALAIAVVLTSKNLRLGALALACLAIQAAAGRSSFRCLRKVLLLIPLFSFLAATVWALGADSFQQKLLKTSGLFFKTFIVFWIVSLLMETTLHNDLIGGLRRMGVPALFTEILFFAFRYKNILFREAERMRHAMESRGASRAQLAGRNLKRLSAVMAHFLMRVLNRSHRIYAAMLARGYSGRLPCGFRRYAFSRYDFIFLGAVAFYLGTVLAAL